MSHIKVTESHASNYSTFFSSWPTGEETLHWFQLPPGRTRGQWHSADKRGTNPHGLPPRDSVQWAQFSSGRSEDRVWLSDWLHQHILCLDMSSGIKGHRLHSICNFLRDIFIQKRGVLRILSWPYCSMIKLDLQTVFRAVSMNFANYCVPHFNGIEVYFSFEGCDVYLWIWTYENLS